MGFVKKATAIVALITAIVTLAYKFWPQPDPVRKADMAEPRVEAGLTFEQYLERTDQDPGDLSDEVLAQRGALVQFTVEATGYKGDGLRLRWEVIDTGTHDRVLASDAITITPSADTDRLRPPPVFAPFPDQGGPFVARGEVFAPDGVSLAEAEMEFARG
jgi:hypothetical protein